MIQRYSTNCGHGIRTDEVGGLIRVVDIPSPVLRAMDAMDPEAAVTQTPSMDDDEWVKKINDLGAEMDEIANSVHPSLAIDITAELRKKYRILAQKQ